MDWLKRRQFVALEGADFLLQAGQTLGVMGESGSGKSVTSLALMRLVEHGGGKIVNGSAALRRRNGQVLDVVKAGNATMRDVRGADVAMIFQEPMTSLNPVFTAGEQIAESIRNHQGMDRAAARAEALRMLVFGLAMVLIMLRRPAGLWPAPQHGRG